MCVSAARFSRIASHLPFFALACLFLATGCVRMHPTRCGYLSDYSQMHTIGNGDLRLMTPDAESFTEIDSIYIEPVQWLADDLGQPASSPERTGRIRAAFETALYKELSEIKPIVDEPGPRTARVRAAITAVQEAKPLVNVMCIWGFVGPLFNGGAVAEIEVLNPQGQQIVAESIAYRGRDWELLGFFYGPLHAESAVKRMSHQLAGQLDPSKSSGSSSWLPGKDGAGTFPGVASLSERSNPQ